MNFKEPVFDPTFLCLWPSPAYPYEREAAQFVNDPCEYHVYRTEEGKRIVFKKKYVMFGKPRNDSRCYWIEWEWQPEVNAY